MTCADATTSGSAKTCPSGATAANCPACETAKSRKWSGMYRFQCLKCCARLVLSAHPNKRQAAVMLAAIARFPDAPGRAEVLACVAQELTKHPSVGPKSSTE